MEFIYRIVEGVTRRALIIASSAYDAVSGADRTTIVRRESVLIQTHNAVNIPLTSFSLSTLIPVNGYDRLRLAGKFEASVARHANVQWYADAAGTVLMAEESMVASGSGAYISGELAVKGLSAKIVVFNDDAALPHTLSTWTTLVP